MGHAKKTSGCACGAALGKPQVLRLCLRMTFFLEWRLLEWVGVVIPLKPTDGLNGAPKRLSGCACGAALGKPQVLRLCLRMTFFLGMAIVGMGWSGDPTQANGWLEWGTQKTFRMRLRRGFRQPQILRLCLRMTFFLGIAIVGAPCFRTGRTLLVRPIPTSARARRRLPARRQAPSLRRRSRSIRGRRLCRRCRRRCGGS